MPLVSCKKIWHKDADHTTRQCQRRNRNSGMARFLSLKHLCKTVRKMYSPRSPQPLAQRARSPGAWLGLLLLPTMELSKQWHHHRHGNPVVLSQGTETWCLGSNSESSSSHSRIPIPEFPFQKQHVPLARLPGLESLLCSVLWPQRSLLEGKAQSVPLKPDSVWSLRKVLLSLVLFLIFTLGHFPFSSRSGKRIHPGWWSQLLTIHYT